jgi:hypothetical protein
LLPVTRLNGGVISRRSQWQQRRREVDVSHATHSDGRRDNIGDVLDQLRCDCTNGDISCLAVAVIRPTGQLTTIISGIAASDVLLGAIELLKVPILKDELAALQAAGSAGREPRSARRSDAN